jgi:hypothetical protein
VDAILDLEGCPPIRHCRVTRWRSCERTTRGAAARPGPQSRG